MMSSQPKCPNCLRNYSFSQAGLQPRILSCKHSFCKQCVVKLLRAKKEHCVICPKCKVETAVTKGDKNLQCLPVNLFLVGLTCMTVKQQINPFDVKLEYRAKPKSDNAQFESRELKGGRPPCLSCQQCPADCLCQHCDIHMCNSCFITIHKNITKNTHAKVSLLTSKVYGCSEHDNMPREFFCQDDKEPICAKCGLTGEHKGHNITHIQEKISEAYKDLDPAFTSAKSTLKKLYHTKEIINKEQLRLKKDSEKVREEVQGHFTELFAELQLKFLSLEENISDASTSQLENLSHINNNLASNICRLTTVMEDVQPSLKDKAKAPSNLTEMISILRGAPGLPWYLAQDGKAEAMTKYRPGELTVSSKVEVNHDRFHTLKSSSELPGDFVEPIIDDSILRACPLFGSDEKKKKKAIGPDHVRILQKEGVLPADLTETRERLVGRPRLDVKSQNRRQFVRVVHIRSPVCFYIHYQSDQSRLEKMMRSLSSICKSIADFSKYIPDPIQIGTKCCCKFDDGQWYRAMVKTVPDDVTDVLSVTETEDLIQANEQDQLKVEVIYIDYGNTQWVPVTKLVRLKPRFEREAPFAVTCALYDILPPDQNAKWPKESAEAFATMVATQDVPLVMSTHGDVDDILQVDIHQSPNTSVVDDAPVSIRDAMIFLELASFINDTPTPQTPKSPVPPRKYLPPDVPCVGESIMVTACNIIDPYHFWVHETGVMESSLIKMMEELQVAYRNRSSVNWTILCPQLDMICVAKYVNDKKWYRAQIIGLPGKRQVEVLYIDYGNIAVIECTQIRKITETFLKLPIMALPCKLTDVAPKDQGAGWSQEAALHFSEIVSYKPVELHVYNDEDNFASVVAFDITLVDRVNLNALLVQSGHANSSGPASFTPEMFRPNTTGAPSTAKVRSSSPAAKSMSPCEPSSARKKEMYTAVHVSHVESPSCIYLQLATASKDGLDSLLEAMTLHYKDSESVMDHDWTEGDPCAALLVRERVWCRGEIISFLPENNLVVLFTDYGNKEILTLANIRPLEDKFQEESPFAICCHVTGVIPAGGKDWTQTASHFLKDKLSDLDCYISQKGNKGEGSLPVDLLYELTGQEMLDQNTDDELENISELLIKEGLALRDRKKSPSKSKETTTLDEESTKDRNRLNVEFSPLQKHSPGKRTPGKLTPGKHNLGEAGDIIAQKVDECVDISPSQKNNDQAVINESGDSGIVNPDHGTISSPYEGTNVDGAFSGGRVDLTTNGGIHLSSNDMPIGLVQGKGSEDTQEVSTQEETTDNSEDKTRNVTLTKDDDETRNEGSLESSPVPTSMGGVEKNVEMKHTVARPSEYLPPTLPVNKEFMIAVSFVGQEGLVHGLEVEKLSVLQVLMDDLQGFCQQPLPPSSSTTLNVNQAICAKFNIDDKWYRASVTRVSEGSVEVCYIDFGNSEVVPLQDIHSQPFQVELPQQSLCCQLYGVTQILPEKSSFLAHMVTEQTVTITTKEACETGKPLVVDMTLPNGQNVANILITQGLISSKNQLPTHTERAPLAGCDNYGDEIFDEDDFLDSSDCAEVALNQNILPEQSLTLLIPEKTVLPPEELLEEAGLIPPHISQFQPLNFPLGWKEFLAEVPCIQTPDLVYLQYSTTFRDGPYQDHDLMLLYEEFVKMHAELNKLALSFPSITHPVPGMSCLAYYNIDKQWYRGEIISVQGGPALTCSVRFVDYGTVESLPVDSICHLQAKYMELPTQCRLCKIEGLLPPSRIPPGFPVADNSNWPIASSNAMVQLIKNKIFLATILEDGPLPIINLYSCQFSNGGIKKGPPMFLNLIETGLADVGAGLSDYLRSKSTSPM